MNRPYQPSKRRRRETSLAPEALESRDLMTGGIGDTFAIISGTISKANQPVAIKVTFDPTHFTIPKGKFMLGIDIAAGSGSTISPQIVSVQKPNGAADPLTHSRYTKGLTGGTVTPGSQTPVVLTPVQFDHKNPNGTVTYTVNVRGLKGTTGSFLLGFYLPGDANGDGTVDQTDIKAIEAEKGFNASNSSYTFDADTNRDGIINATDLKVAQENLGVKTTINPSVTSNLSPTGQTMTNSRVLTVPSATFTGTVTPGAVVTYQSTTAGSKPVSDTADSLGNYSVTVPLALGNNTFNVTSTDPFGQTITGTLSPVTYSLTAANPPTPAQTTTPTPTPTAAAPMIPATTPTPTPTHANNNSRGSNDRGDHADDAHPDANTTPLQRRGHRLQHPRPRPLHPHRRQHPHQRHRRRPRRHIPRRRRGVDQSVASGSGGEVSRACRASSPPICRSAQVAASRIVGSGSFSRRIRAGTASVTWRWPRIKAALRSRPARFARESAVPLRKRDISTGSRSSQSIRSGFVSPGLASSSGMRPAGALRFQGQTSWQMSQPKTQPSSWSAKASSIGPLCSMVQ